MSINLSLGWLSWRNEANCAKQVKRLLVEVGAVNPAQIASYAALRRNDQKQERPFGRSCSQTIYSPAKP